MNIVFVAVVLLVLVFGVAALFGAPYLPTLDAQIKSGLDLLDLKPGQTLLELGCGDGKVLKAAAQRGIRGIGYEINPVLVILAVFRTRKYRHLVKVKWANYWTAELPEAEAIFTFLISKYMAKLDNKIVHYTHKPVKVVSVAFKIPGQKPLRHKNAVYLYIYR